MKIYHTKKIFHEIEYFVTKSPKEHTIKTVKGVIITESNEVRVMV